VFSRQPRDQKRHQLEDTSPHLVTVEVECPVGDFQLGLPLQRGVVTNCVDTQARNPKGGGREPSRGYKKMAINPV
jgi:hypothetical protein